ncbi:MAG TPA: hypothetical protein VGQ26_26580 [Streptosporangiaceae bacterium]|jgi:uncharacterized delta-60 repeat protein|nr:hypothetical protein [Streptosporangiaceae bacterium]
MASPGDLDTSFSGDGKRTISFGGVDTANVVLVQPNGRIVVAGSTRKVSTAPSRFCVARLRSNGTLDTAFGSGGKRVISFGGDSLGESVFGAALQPDGKIVLAGGSDLRAAVARLNPNGSLDTTFSGDGKKTFNWAPGDFSRTQAVLVLPNGKLVVAGFSGPEGGDIQAARLKTNGALDTAFGTGGKARVDFGDTEFGFAAARQADGRIVVAGRSLGSGAAVARLRANGTLDPDFDGDGRLMLPGGGEARAVLVQPDSKIVVTGNPGLSEVTTVTRLNPNGSPDTTFNGDGTATIDFGASGAVLQPDGKIVVAGTAQAGVAVARLNANGSPDATFGAAGKVAVDFGAATSCNAVALQPNGRIVVAGQRSGGDFAVARLLG